MFILLLLLLFFFFFSVTARKFDPLLSVSIIGTWQPAGCFQNKKGYSFALPYYFGSNVGKKGGIDKIFKYCSAQADSVGYKVFGVDDQNCWTGDNAYDKYGKSSKCSIKKGRGIGKNNNGNIFVYILEY